MGKTTVQEFNFRKFVHFWAFLRGGGEGRFKKPENRQCFLQHSAFQVDCYFSLFFFSKDMYVFKENIFLSVRILFLMPVVLYRILYALKGFQTKSLFHSVFFKIITLPYSYCCEMMDFSKGSAANLMAVLLLWNKNPSNTKYKFYSLIQIHAFLCYFLRASQ